MHSNDSVSSLSLARDDRVGWLRIKSKFGDIAEQAKLTLRSNYGAHEVRRRTHSSQTKNHFILCHLAPDGEEGSETDQP